MTERLAAGKTSGRRHSVCEFRLAPRRGSCKWKVEEFSSLQPNEIVQSNVFELGNYKWKLALINGPRDGSRMGIVKIFLFSCNDKGVRVDVHVGIEGRGNLNRSPSEGKTKVAPQFTSIQQLSIPFEELLRNLNAWGELKVIVDLKYIKEATIDEQRASERNIRTITVEIIEEESIIRNLNRKTDSKLVPSDSQRYLDVNGCTLVHLWAGNSPDYRHWLCTRCTDGSVVVGRCLNEARMLECFERICDNRSGGSPWVTILREKKKPNEIFQPIRDDTIIVFFMLRQEPYQDLVYLGHLLVRETMPCYALCDEIVNDMVRLHDDQQYKMYLAKDGQPNDDLSCKTSPLSQCKVKSGSVLIVEPEMASEHEPGENCLYQASRPEEDRPEFSNNTSDTNSKLGSVTEEPETLPALDMASNEAAQAKTETVQSDCSENAGLSDGEDGEIQANGLNENGFVHPDGSFPLGQMEDRKIDISPRTHMHSSTKHAIGALQTEDGTAATGLCMQTVSSTLSADCQSGARSTLVGESSSLTTQGDCENSDEKRHAQLNKNDSMHIYCLPLVPKQDSEEKRTALYMEPRTPEPTRRCTKAEDEEFTKYEDVCDKGNLVQLNKEPANSVKEPIASALEDVSKETPLPIMKEIKEVKVVADSKETGKATHQKIRKATLMVNIQLEKLTN